MNQCVDLEKGQASLNSEEKSSPDLPRHGFNRFLRKLTFSSGASTIRDDEQRAAPLQDEHPVSVRRLTDCHPGYPRLAAFQDSDECFMMYRRFGYLQARILSDKQDELRVLEERLADLDAELFEQREVFTQTRTKIANATLKGQRANLMDEITNTYCIYSNLLVAASQVVALHRPGKSDYRSVQSFCVDEPLCRAENKWIEHKEDLITLKPGREHAWLDAMIEHLLRWLHCSFIEKLFCSPETKRKTEGREEAKEVYYTKSRIETLVNLILLVIILILLIVPTYALYHLVEVAGSDRADAACMGVLLVATLAFSAVLAAFTRAKRHEILAAAAAYCAVLVVFLGNVPQGVSILANGPT